MTSLSEFAIFKHCVENPQRLDKNLSQLNLRFVRDPSDPVPSSAGQDGADDKSTKDAVTSAITAEPESLEARQRKATRLYYSVWSGVTKCLRNIVQGQQRAVEIPNFAIFGPVLDKFARLKDPLNKGPKRKVAAAQLGLNPVFVVVNDDFLNMMDWQVAVDSSTNKAVGRFNKFDKSEVAELFNNQVQSLNLASIASVCFTDASTVENLLNELFATISNLAKAGKQIRLNFKCGYLIFSNGVIQWQHSRELLQRHGVTMNEDGEQSSIPSTIRQSEFQSVVTPSIARFSRATTTDKNNWHSSNPNPQTQATLNFKGVRDSQSNTQRGDDIGDQVQLDFLKFGKRVQFGQLTSGDVLEAHLKQIHDHKQMNRYEKDIKLQQEREHLKRIKAEIEQTDSQKMRSSEVLKNEFLFFNDQKKLDNKVRKEYEERTKRSEEYNHFPFISGDLIEQHRNVLGTQLRTDLKNYMSAKSRDAFSGTNYSAKKDRYSPKNASEKFSDIHINSDRLVRGSQVTAGLLKPLNDSCYVIPEKNHQVLQDSNPIRSQTFKEALARYENEIEKKKQSNEQVLSSHFQKIKKDEDIFMTEKEIAKKKQEAFAKELSDQIAKNEEAKKAAKAELKAPKKTSYGPEEAEEKVMISREMERIKNRDTQQQVLVQIEERKRKEQEEREMKLAAENAEYAINEEALRMQTHARKAAKAEVQDFWKQQLEAKKQQAQREKEAAEVLQKQIAV